MGGKRIGSFAALAAALFGLMLAAGMPARADYTDGALAAKRISQETGIRIWRKAAWLDDDFLSEIQLGDIYGSENGDNKFYDPVESYVWYFLATKSGRFGEHVTDGYARRIVSNDIHRAYQHQSKLMILLSAEERQEARNRIVYILSCRGADGYVQLGQIHTTGLNNGGYGNEFANDSPDTYGALSDMARSYGSFRDRSEREFNSGQEAQARQMMGVSSTSAIVRNDGEALTYFHIADNMGHPLAREYLRGLDRGVRRNRPLGDRIADDAARKARYWTAPFEFYPGGNNASGVPYTDECYANLDRQKALVAAATQLPAARRRARPYLPRLDRDDAGRAALPGDAGRHTDRAADGDGIGARDPDRRDPRRCLLAECARRDVCPRHRRAAQLRARGILVQAARPTSASAPRSITWACSTRRGPTASIRISRRRTTT